MENEQRHFFIENYRKEIDEAKKILDKLLEECPHNLVKQYSAARCNICTKYFGHWCPKSKDHMCNYIQQDGEYDEDNCIHCGHPEERK